MYFTAFYSAVYVYDNLKMHRFYISLHKKKYIFSFGIFPDFNDETEYKLNLKKISRKVYLNRSNVLLI